MNEARIGMPFDPNVYEVAVESQLDAILNKLEPHEWRFLIDAVITMVESNSDEFKKQITGIRDDAEIRKYNQTV